MIGMNASQSGCLPMLLLVSLWLVACDRGPLQGPSEPTGRRSGPVTVEFWFGGQVKTFVVDSVADGTTVEAFMRSQKVVPVDMKGRGWTAFVHAIDGVATDSTSGWTYSVDGRFASTGVGSTRLHPPTSLRWRFGRWNEGPLP